MQNLQAINSDFSVFLYRLILILLPLLWRLMAWLVSPDNRYLKCVLLDCEQNALDDRWQDRFLWVEPQPPLLIYVRQPRRFCRNQLS